MSKQQSNIRMWPLFFTIIMVEILFWGGAYFFYDYITQNASNFRFEHEWVLWYGLPVIVIFTLGYFYIQLWRNKTIRQLGKKALLTYIFKGYSTLSISLKYTFWRLGVAFLIIAASNPQFGTKEREVESKGIEIMIAIDVSSSMLAEDLATNYSRLKVTKLAIEKLLDKLSGDHIGLVVFAGAAYKQLPITPDYNAAKLFLQNVNTDMITAQGTDIGNAINTCMSSFNFDNGVSKTIIIFSDGEDHEQSALEAAELAHEQGVIIHTIGMGGEMGAPIPLMQNGQKVGTKKDKEGNTVLTKLNEKMLIDVANAGGGSYSRANGMSVGLEGLVEQINTTEKSALGKEKYTAYDDHFQPFLWLGILLLLIDILILENKTTLREHFKISKL